MQENGALLHAGQRGDADMPPVIGQLRVDFVGNDQEVVFDGERGDVLDIFTLENGAGRIVGKIQQ